MTQKPSPPKAEDILTAFLSLSLAERKKVVNAIKEFDVKQGKEEGEADTRLLYDSISAVVLEDTGLVLPTYKGMCWAHRDFERNLTTMVAWCLYPTTHSWGIKDKVNLFRIAAMCAYYVFPPTKGFGSSSAEKANNLVGRVSVALECAFPSYRASMLYPMLAKKAFDRDQAKKLILGE